MPGEIITIQAGQCGNQVGSLFWQQLCKEHQISSLDGSKLDSTDSLEPGRPRTGPGPGPGPDEQTDCFFSKNQDDNRYTPRAILIDMEPRVINSIVQQQPQFYNPRNIHLASHGAGAGNIWAEGYQYGNTHQEELIDLLDKNLDNCDSMEAFQLIHSVAGGTGSGVGSSLLELLSDRYSKKIVTTFSIFPEMDQTSDVVVQPYNTVLTLKRLIENSDANIVFDNSALSNLFQSETPNPSYTETNQLISTVMSTFTNTLRFPSYSYNSMTSILANLIPTPDLHFLTPTYTPFTIDYVSNAKDIRKTTTAYDVILELLDKKLKMVSTSSSSSSSSPGNNGYNISMMNFIQGYNSVDQNKDIQKALIKAQQRSSFVPWTTSSIHLAILKQPRNFQDKKNFKGLSISNNTSIVQLFKKITSQYDKLIRRQAFMESYKRFDDMAFEFSESRDMVGDLIEEYTRAESMAYIEDDEDGDEGYDEDDEVIMDENV